MTNPRSAYRENDVRGASPSRLVVLLYDQLVQDLNRALQALEQNEIEQRTRHINHAVLVLGHLQSALDFENGGKVAKDLDNYYNVLRQSLVHAQFLPSKGAIGQLVTDVVAVREAWTEVERSEQSPSIQTGERMPAAAANPAPASGMNWEG